MGEIADMMIDGTLDMYTGEYIGDAVGYPRQNPGNIKRKKRKKSNYKITSSMKTIKCTFGGSGRQYSFNIENDDVKVGDILKSDGYRGKLHVMAIEDKVYRNFDYKTGALGTGTGIIKVLPSDTVIIRVEQAEQSEGRASRGESEGGPEQQEMF